MAEALLRRAWRRRVRGPQRRYRARGANPLTLRVLADAGIDASWARSKSVDEFLGQSFDYVITVATRPARSARSSLASTSRSTGATRTRRRPTRHRGGAPGRLPTGLHPIGERVQQFAAIATRAPRAPPPDAAPPCPPCRRRRSGGVERPGRGPAAQRQGPTPGGAPRRVPCRPRRPRRTRSSPRPRSGPCRRPRSSRATSGSPSRPTTGWPTLSTSPTLDALLTDAGDPERPILFGHDPDFSEFVDEPVRRVNVPMRKGALAKIEVDRPLRAGGGTLRWLIPPDALRSRRTVVDR